MLNAHNQFDIGAQIGVVVPGSVRLDAGKGSAVLQLTSRDDAAPIVADIAAGIIRNISVGYRRYVVELDASTNPPLCRTTDWEPMEISFVTVPADPGAQVRTAGEHHPCIVRNVSPKESKR